MIKIFNECRVKYFEYFYMVVMVVYMAQMTFETSRMVGGLSGNPIPLVFPMLLTVILVIRNKIEWYDKGFFVLILLFLTWVLLVLAKYNAFTVTVDLSYVFFLFYAVLIAYIHSKVYQKHYFAIYEHIMVWVCKISVVMWMLNVVLFSSLRLDFLQPTDLGWNVMYLYNWICPERAISDVFAIILRNSGFSWEPGRFAIMITLALFVNLMRNGIKFKGNREVLWLLVALLSTQSTTGYVVAILLYLVFATSILNFRNVLIVLILIISVSTVLLRLDFMQAKIMEQLDFEKSLSEMNDTFDWGQSQFADDEYLGSLGRFESFYFNIQNALADPLLGHSRNFKHSLFYEQFSSNFSLTGGVASMFAQYGFPMGIIIFILLGISSISVARLFQSKHFVALFLIVLLSSVSYNLWCIPVFTTFWLYGVFEYKA